jgi:hypothetical protein
MLGIASGLVFASLLVGVPAMVILDIGTSGFGCD